MTMTNYFISRIMNKYPCAFLHPVPALTDIYDNKIKETSYQYTHTVNGRKYPHTKIPQKTH